MPTRPDRLRLASYNLHKCRGMTGPYAPERNLRIIAEMGADVIALQEVDFRHGARPEALPRPSDPVAPAREAGRERLAGGAEFVTGGDDAHAGGHVPVCGAGISHGLFLLNQYLRCTSRLSASAAARAKTEDSSAVSTVARPWLPPSGAMSANLRWRCALRWA